MEKKRMGVGKKILLALVAAVLLLMVIGALSGDGETLKDKDPGDIIAEYGECKAEILYCGPIPDYEGTPAVKMTLSFQNNGTDGLYLLEAFDIRAYLDGIEMDYISLNDESPAAQNTIRAVKGGETLNCDMVFSYPHSGTVEFVISTPTADRVQLAKTTVRWN